MINPNVLLMNNLLMLYTQDGKTSIDLSEITAPNLVALTRVNFNAARVDDWLSADIFNKIKMEARLELARRYAALLDMENDLETAYAEWLRIGAEPSDGDLMKIDRDYFFACQRLCWALQVVREQERMKPDSLKMEGYEHV